MSYQNSGPIKIEQLGLTPEELRQRKNRRRMLFTGVAAIFSIAFFVMVAVVRSHQKQNHSSNGGYINYDGDDDSTSGRGRVPRTFDEKSISLDDLNLRSDSSILSGCETSVILIRHCEKQGEETLDEEGNEHCSYLGFERAQFIPTLFGEPGESDKWPVPVALYALSEERSGHSNFREIETLTPLANKYGLEIESNSHNNKEMVEKIYKGLSSGGWCGKTILVSWKHAYLGDLAQLLGCVDCPDDYPDMVFDEVWQLKYVYDVEGTVAIKSSHMKSTPLLSSEASNNDNLRRNLKKKKSSDKKLPPSKKKWSVYSTITQQNFDPLKFSNSVGDYAGDMVGGKWFQDSSIETPEEGEM